MALRRSLTQWHLLLVVTTVAILACTLVTSIGVLVTATEQSAVRNALAASPVEETQLTLSLFGPAQSLGDSRAQLDAAVEQLLPGRDAAATGLALSELYSVPREGRLAALAYFGELDSIDTNATLLEGQWPTTGAGETSAGSSSAGVTTVVAIPEQAAATLGLGVGDELAIRQGLRSPVMNIGIVGIYSTENPGSRYWTPDLLRGKGLDDHYTVPNSSGALFTDAVGPLIVAPGTFDAAEAANAAATPGAERAIPAAISRFIVRYDANFGDTSVNDLAPLLERLGTATDDVPRNLGPIAESVAYASGLSGVVGTVASTLTLTRSTVVVLSLLLIVLAVAALTQTARLLTEARLAERHLMRARGASGRQLVVLAAIEAVAIAAITAGVSPLLARLVYQGVAQQPAMATAGMAIDPGLPTLSWLTAVGTALLFAAVLVAPLLKKGGTFHEGEQGKSRQRRSPLQRSGLDLALVLLAAIAYWQLLSYRSPAGQDASVGVDPLLAVGPTFTLLAGALLCVRLVPAAARLTERIASRARGAVVPLAAWEIGRRSQRAIAAILLLTLALAVGTFSLSFLASWRQSQIDQAAFAVGPPTRAAVATEGSQPAFHRLATVADADVASGGLPIDGPEAVVLGITGPSRTLLQRDRVAEEGGNRIASLLKKTPDDAAGVELGDDVTTISAVARFDSDLPLPTVRGSVYAILQGEAGVLTTIPLGIAFVDGEEYDLAGEVPAGMTGQDGLRLVGLRSDVFVGEQTATDGNPKSPATMSIKGLTVANAAGDERLVDVPDDITWFSSGGGRATFESISTVAEPGWQFGIQFIVPIGLIAGKISVAQIGWPAVGDVPAVLSRDLATQLRAKSTTRLTLALDGSFVPIRVVGSVARVPGTPESSALTALTVGSNSAAGGSGTVVVDQKALARSFVETGVLEPAVDEWWSGSASSSSALPEDGVNGAVLGAAMQEHPLRVATQGVLWLVTWGAALLAAIGFAIHATSTLRARGPEFAGLRAIGISKSKVTGVVALESLLLGLFGTVFGVGLGVLLSLMVAPLIGASADGVPPVPDVTVLIPWADVALLVLEVAAVLALVVFVVARTQRDEDTATVLRRGEER